MAVKNRSGKYITLAKTRGGRLLKHLCSKVTYSLLSLLSHLPQEKLEKAAEAFEAAEELHLSFVTRVDQWMLNNYSRAIDLFRRFDLNGDGCLTYEEFYAGMRDLHAPCNKIELYVMAKKLDQDGNGLIDYLEFSKGLRYFRPTDCAADSDLPPLTIVREKLEECPCCKLGLWKPYKEKYPR